MANLFDYLVWRGDLSLAESPFNDIDNLILARFSYFDFNGILEENETITIKEAAKRYEAKKQKRVLQEEDLELFPALREKQSFSKYEDYKFC